MFDGIRSIPQAPSRVSLPIHVDQENPLLTERAHHRTADGCRGFGHASFLVGIHIAFHPFLLRANKSCPASTCSFSVCLYRQRSFCLLCRNRVVSARGICTEFRGL